VAANDIYDQGLWWEQFGGIGHTFQVGNATTLTVRLSDQGTGAYIVGDAVRVEQLNPLLVDAPASGVTGAAVTSLDAVPRSLVQQAAALWSAAEPQLADRLANVEVIVADLPGQTLGLASAWTQTIWLDADAAGQGWSGVGDRWSGVGGRSPITGVDLLTVIAHELGHVLGLGHAEDAHGLMADTLPAGVRRLPLPQFDGHGELFRPGFLSSRSAAGAESDLARALALGDWGSFSDGDLAEAGGLSAGRVMAGRGRAVEAVEDAALLAWADDDEEDDAEVLIGLRRDDEDEHSERVDSVFEASDDWGLLPGWQTEDRPRDAARR
jgi:hypothetical protein